MKFGFFHLMPYADFSTPEDGWPVRNDRLDPQRAGELYSRYIETLVFAEECGFDWIGLNEHHFSPYGLMANPNVVGGALAYRTKTVKIAVCGNLVPINNPVRIAEEYAMLDCMSGGRLIAGLIRGAPHEYLSYNIPASESWERQREGVDLILKAWTERRPFAFNGKHYQFPQVAIWPRPIQQPYPPLLMSATSPDSVRFAAEKRAIMAMNMFIFDLAVPKRMIRLYYECAQQNGWTPNAEHVLIGMHCCIADTDEEARHWLGRGQRYLSGTLLAATSQAHQAALDGSTYHPDAQHRAALERRAAAPWPSIEEQIEAGTVICGTAETAIRQIEHAQRELGHGIFNLTMKVGNVPDEVVTHSMELFRDRVKPALAKVETDHLLRT